MKQVKSEEKTALWSVQLESLDQRRWWDRLTQVYEVYQMVSNQPTKGGDHS